MNTLSIRSLRAAAATLVLALTPFTAAHAEAPVQRSTIDVPFAFACGSSTLPAGHYTVARMTDHIIRLSNGNGTWMGTTMPEIGSRTPSEGKAVFHKIGDQYFLSEFWTAGNNTHLNLFASKVEKEARKSNLASAHSAPVTYELAVLQTR